MYSWARYLVCFLILILTKTALAESSLQRIRHGQQGLQTQYDDDLTERQQQRLYRWLTQLSSDFVTAFGELPRDRIRIRIEKTAADEPVPWGQVNRKVTNEILFVVDPDFSFDDFASDWTAYHEFAHLLIPYRGWGDLWFSEGLASYYQNLLQARAGRFSEERMWEKLLAGFERGHDSSGWNGTDLRSVGDNLGVTHQQMRTHWSGVLYWLTMDARLRAAGEHSVDSLLADLKECCQLQQLSARQLVQKLDQLAGLSPQAEHGFERLFDEYRSSLKMPDHQPVLRQLGVDYRSWFGGIRFEPDAEWASVRQQLARRPE